MTLLRLAGHYHRPDFTAEQANAVIRDMVMEDLAEYSVAHLEHAIREYRRNPKNRFFPTSGQLRELCDQARTQAKWDSEGGSKRQPEFGESRPYFWWLQRREWWKPHWREEEIPASELKNFWRNQEARKNGK